MICRGTIERVEKRETGALPRFVIIRDAKLMFDGNRMAAKRVISEIAGGPRDIMDQARQDIRVVAGDGGGGQIGGQGPQLCQLGKEEVARRFEYVLANAGIVGSGCNRRIVVHGAAPAIVRA